MHKVKVLALVVMCLAVAPRIAAAADGKTRIGLIDFRQIVAAHPKSKQAAQELEREKASREKQFEAKVKAKFKVDNPDILTDAQKEELRKMYEAENEKFNREMSALLEKKQKEVEGDILKAVSIVSKKKGLDYVLDKNLVFFGGQDITKDVIAEMKSGK